MFAFALPADGPLRDSRLPVALDTTPAPCGRAWTTGRVIFAPVGLPTNAVYFSSRSHLSSKESGLGFLPIIREHYLFPSSISISNAEAIAKFGFAHRQQVLKVIPIKHVPIKADRRRCRLRPDRPNIKTLGNMREQAKQSGAEAGDRQRLFVQEVRTDS